MTFQCDSFTVNGVTIHAVVTDHKAVKLFRTEDEALDEAERLNEAELSLKTKRERADWFRRWSDAPDLRLGPEGQPRPRKTLRARDNTPWGEAIAADHLGDGVYVISTPGHGGLYLPDPVWNALPQAVQEAMFLVRSGQYPGNWAEEDVDLPFVMPFILSRLDPNQLQRTFGPEGANPAFWQQHAERICAQYPEEYGAALTPLQALPPPAAAE